MTKKKITIISALYLVFTASAVVLTVVTYAVDELYFVLFWNIPPFITSAFLLLVAASPLFFLVGVGLLKLRLIHKNMGIIGLVLSGILVAELVLFIIDVANTMPAAI